MEIAIEIISLLTGLVGLISAGVTAFFAIKTFAQSLKDKKANEIWNLIMTIADAAMKEAEASQLDGESKKQLVIDTVKVGVNAAGVDITDFLDQLNDYIDDTIAFVNGLQKAKELNK
jgi:hypothetical protein